LTLPKVAPSCSLGYNRGNIRFRAKIVKQESGYFWVGVSVICLLAFIAISILNHQIFERVPHSEDEVAYVFQAKVFAQHKLSVPTPANARAFWTPFVVDYNGQRFGKYAPGWPLLLSLGFRVDAPWLVNTLLGTLTLALIAWLGRYCYRVSVGLGAAALGLVTPGFLFLSASLLSHAASLLWTTVALVALCCLMGSADFTGVNSAPITRNPKPITQNSPIYGAILGLALGFVFITRPFAGLGIGVAVGGFMVVSVWRGEQRWTGLLWFLVGSLAIAALSPLYWWTITGNPTFNAYTLVWPYDRVGFGPDIGPLGYTLSNAIFINTYLKLVTLATGLFGWPGWNNLVFVPVPFLTGRANRWDWLLLSTILGIIFAHIFYWAFGGVDGGFPRYYYDALPALLLLTIRGLQICIQLFDRLAVSKFKLGWLPVGLVGVFIAYNLIFNLPSLLAAQKGKYGITPAPLLAVEQANLTEPALIFVKNVDGWSDFAAPFAANSPTLDGPVVYAIDWGPEFNQRVRAQFKERVCWELAGKTLKKCE
jgi:4-amino-4-deoxy-L-arabinose transferase-like glycosyltransferase